LHSESKNNSTLIGWLICGLGAVFYSYEYILRIAPSAMEPALREHFNLSASGFGHISSIYYYAYVPMQLPVGILLDRYGPRRLLTFACLVCVIGTFLFTSSSLFWIAAVGRFLVGLGSAFAFVGVLKLATLWLPENRLAMVSGLTAALGTVGAILGDLFLEHFVEQFGWVKTLNSTAIFGMGLVFVLWMGIHDRKGHHKQSGTVSSFKKGFIDLEIILRNKQIWINGLYGCLVYLPTTVFAELWGIPYLTHAHGLTSEAAGFANVLHFLGLPIGAPSAAGFANSMLFLGFTIGAPLMGYISDKLARRKFPMFIGAAGASVVMMMILYLPGLKETHIQGLMFLLGLLYSAQAIVFAVGRELSPGEAAGTAMAFTNMLVMLGAMLLQPLVGHLLDFSYKAHQAGTIETGMVVDNLQKMYTVNDYQFALFVIPLGILIAALLTFFLKETYAHAKK
jgi:MFS family permease